MDISVVIINYNTCELTCKCVESIIENTKNRSYEVILIDNASEIEDYKRLQSFVDQVKDKIQLTLVRSRLNSGFAGGCYRGAELAEGKYVAFINSDVELIENSLDVLQKFMDVTPDAGVCSAIQLGSDYQPLKVSFGHFHGVTRDILGDKLIEVLFRKPSRGIEHKEAVKVDFVSGSFMFFRRSVFNKLGGFDTNIFLYFEEMDICFRMKRLGYYAYHVPFTKYYHLIGASSPNNYPYKIEGKLSHLYVIRKNSSNFEYVVFRVWLLVKYFFKAIFQPKHWKMFYRLIFLGSPLAHSLKNKQRILEE